MTTLTSSPKTKRFLVLALLASLTLGPNLLGGNLLATVYAKGNDSHGNNQKPNKVASDLNDLLSKRAAKRSSKLFSSSTRSPAVNSMHC